MHNHSPRRLGGGAFLVAVLWVLAGIVAVFGPSLRPTTTRRASVSSLASKEVATGVGASPDAVDAVVVRLDGFPLPDYCRADSEVSGHCRVVRVLNLAAASSRAAPSHSLDSRLLLVSGHSREPLVVGLYPHELARLASRLFVEPREVHTIVLDTCEAGTQGIADELHRAFPAATVLGAKREVPGRGLQYPPWRVEHQRDISRFHSEMVRLNADVELVAFPPLVPELSTANRDHSQIGPATPYHLELR